MATISINEFQIIAGTGIEDYILLSYNGGQGGKIAVGTFKAQMTPSIKDGKWWVGGESTNIIAEGKDGKTPQFRRGANGIEYAYEGEDAWSLLVPYSELKLNFDDLTSEQQSMLKLTFSDLTPSDIAELQKPANDMIAVLESTNTQMQAAKEDAQDTADHPTYVGADYYVYKWNKNTQVYDNTGIYVKGEQGIQGEKGEKGDKGENGTGSGNVLVDASGVVKGKQYVFAPSQNGSAEGSFVELVQEDTSGFVTDKELEDVLKGKQDAISDIDTIRENAKKGKDALESLGNKSDKIEVIEHGTSDTTFTLTPNVFHKWGEVSNLSLTLATPSDSTIYNEYMFEFYSGDTATTLTLPDSIKWVSNPSVEVNKIYQCSIVNGIGVITSVENE